MTEITPGIRIDERDLHFAFVRGAGPGGQNVNKVATAVQLRFNIQASSLPAGIKARLLSLAGSRATAHGVLLIEARRYRTQERNRQDALDRFVALVRKATQKPKARKATKPSGRSRALRLQAKKRRSQLKQARRPGSWSE